MDFLKTIGDLAPTVATALGGPLAGGVVSAIGGLFGLESPTVEGIQEHIAKGNMTPDQVVALKKLELEYQSNEKERGFRYSELAFKDRDSARNANVAGNMQSKLFYLSVLLVMTTLIAEIWMAFNGTPPHVPELIIGRVLGLLDSICMTILAYWFGTSHGSSEKTEMLSKAQPIK